MKYTNIQLDTYMNVLSQCLDANGVVGFAIAHNFRKIKDQIKEYIDKKNEIIRKYGETRPNGDIAISDPEKLDLANNELEQYAKLEVSCDIMKVEEEAFRDCGLSARHILALDFMTKPTVKTEGMPVDPNDPIGDDDRFGI